MNSNWTDVEREYIRRNAHLIHDELLAKKLSVMSGRKITINAIRKQRRKMGLKKSCGRGICKVESPLFPNKKIKT